MQENVNANKGDWESLKRLGRYLVGKTRVVLRFEYQDNPGRVEVWTDTDFAGCKRTRKSTSGGIARLGNHLIKSWCSTQSIVSLLVW